MKKVDFMFIILTSVLVLNLSSCAGQPVSTNTAGNPASKSDVIVPPVSKNPGGSTSIMNNLASNSTLVSSSSDLQYYFTDTINIPYCIFTDNKYIYLLRTQDNHPAVEIYDVESGSPIKTIKCTDLKKCSVFTVRDGNLYLFDSDSNKILLYSSGGALLTQYTPTSGSGSGSGSELEAYTVTKMLATKGNKIVMLLEDNKGDSSYLAIFDIKTQAMHILRSYQLAGTPYSNIPGIRDICIMNDSSILVSMTGKSLLAGFDVDHEKPLDYCETPINMAKIEYDGNVLYSLQSPEISFVQRNAANYSNLSVGGSISRLLINNEFPWPKATQEYTNWQLPDIRIPCSTKQEMQYFLSQNSKYIFALDVVYDPASSSTSTTSFSLYRISK